MISRKTKRAFISFLAITALCLFGVTAIFLSGVALPSSDNSSELFADMRSARAATRGPMIDVTEVVQKHIKPGDEVNAALRLLEENGFTTTDMNNYHKVVSEEGWNTYYARRKDKPFSIVSDSYEIKLTSQNGIINDVKAKVVLLAP